MARVEMREGVTLFTTAERKIQSELVAGSMQKNLPTGVYLVEVSHNQGV